MTVFRRRREEDPELLLQLNPARTYTRDEVDLTMSQIGGGVFDGFPIKEWEVVEETSRWFKVEVTFDDYLDPDNDDYEDWYFFKAGEAAPASEQD